jgi:DNA-binding PadR family transcriptional regulator
MQMYWHPRFVPSRGFEKAVVISDRQASSFIGCRPPIRPQNYDKLHYIDFCYICHMDSDSFLPLPTPVFHILVAVADRERHGYAIMQDVAVRTGGKLRMSPGTLYGSIKRMLEDGLIEELDERPDPENDDTRRRYYRITAFGRKVAIAESARLFQLLSQARATGLAPKRS